MITTSQPATPVDELQQRLFDLLGGDDPQEVVPLVESQLAVAERELHEIPLRARERGAEFEKGATAPMGALLEQFQAYHKWLTDLRQALEDQNHSGYVRAHEEAQTLVPALFAAMEAYSRFFASHGPYASPWSNSLARLAEGVVAGQVEEQSWDDTVAGFEQAFQAKLAQVRGASLPGKTACAEAYQHAVEALADLHGSESLQADDLKPHLLALEESSLIGEKIEKLMGEGLEGPTAMPPANIVISVAQKALAQELEVDLAVGFLTDYADLLENYWEAFERSITRPSDSALVQQEIPKALEYGDQHDAAVEALTEALKGNATQAAETAIQQLIATAAKLKESREVFETAAQHKTHAVCPGCGRANPPENRRCEACGNVLPTEAGTGASSTFNTLSGPTLEETQELGMTENVRKLFQACDDVSENHISLDAFQAIVKEAVVGLKDFAREMTEIAEETIDESAMDEETVKIWRETHLPYIAELGQHFEAGIADVEAGLASMLDYVQEQDKEHLINGVRTVWEGLNIIHRTRLAMNSNLKMFQDLLDEAREQGLAVDPPASDMP